jgi:hypothetical protein
MMRDRSQLYPRRTALVVLDDADYWGDSFEARTPLKRNELALLIDKLDAAGVNTVALDVILSSPHPQDSGFEFKAYQTEDDQLYSAIEGVCAAGRHVVLASSVQFDQDGYRKIPSIYSAPLKSYMEPSKTQPTQPPCVVPGHIQLPFDMRRMPGAVELADGGTLDSMALAVTGIADPTAHEEAIAKTGEGFRFSEYLTPDDFKARNGRQFIFSGAQILNTSPAVLRGQLADKLVFVGASWHANALGSTPCVEEPELCVDMHNSPGGMEPGVMLHANYVEAMLDRTGTFAPISNTTAELIEIALALALAMIGVLEIHTAWKWAALAIAIVFSILFTYMLLQNLGLFLDFLFPMLMIVVHSIAEEVLKVWHEFRLLKQNANHKPELEAAGGQG